MAARRLQLSDAVREVLAAMADLELREVHEGPEPRLDAAEGAGPVPGFEVPAVGLAVGRERELAILLAERDSAARPREIEVRVPRHLSASAVVSLAGDPQAFARDLRRPMPAAPASAARRGTAFHAWVEQHFARAAFVDLLDLPGSADDDPAEDEELPGMKERFLASAWAQKIPEAIEIAIETTVEGISIRGRIDAVFPRRGGGFTVVDWKTGAKPSGAKATTRALQLEAYRLAFARLRGLALDKVDAAFYYAGTGETVFLELSDEARLPILLGSIQD
jgi:DNA helicase-2/ATP-dependent DNA helicase PcrA